MQQIHAGDATRLNLLTRDGALSVEFTPALDAEHYTELYGLVRQCDNESELSSAIIQAAHRWDRTVEID